MTVVYSNTATATPNTPPTYPQPGSGDSFIIDTTAAGAQNIQGATTLAQVASIGGFTDEHDPTVFGVTVFWSSLMAGLDGGKRAFIMNLPAAGGLPTVYRRFSSVSNLTVQWKSWFSKRADETSGHSIGSAGNWVTPYIGDSLGQQKRLLMMRDGTVNGSTPRADFVWHNSPPGDVEQECVEGFYGTGESEHYLGLWAPPKDRVVVFTYEVQAATGPTTANGKVRVWRDDEVVYENLAHKSGDPGINGIQLLDSIDNGLPYDETEYIWDIRIWHNSVGI